MTEAGGSCHRPGSQITEPGVRRGHEGDRYHPHDVKLRELPWLLALQRRQPPHNRSLRFSPAGRDFGQKPADQAAAKNAAVISGRGSETLAEAAEDRKPFADST